MTAWMNVDLQGESVAAAIVLLRINGNLEARRIVVRRNGVVAVESENQGG